MGQEPRLRLGPDRLHLVVFGPGFGESIVLRVPENTWIVVDSCRTGKDSPARTLLREHGAHWSCLVLTHPHLDHAAGFDSLLDHPGTGPVGLAAPMAEDTFQWVNSPDPVRHYREGTREAALAAVHSRWEVDPGSRWDLRRGDRRQVGDAAITVLHPDEPTRAAAPSDPNRLSSALLVEWRNVRILLGGDVLSEDWRDIASAYPDLARHAALKMPHHCSLGATHESWGRDGRRRLWVATPWNLGSKHPDARDGKGLDWALRHVEAVHLTGLPVGHNLQGAVPFETTRRELAEEARPAVLRGALPGGRVFRPAPDDPGGDDFFCYVHAVFNADGTLEECVHGPGAVIVRDW